MEKKVINFHFIEGEKSKNLILDINFPDMKIQNNKLILYAPANTDFDFSNELRLLPSFLRDVWELGKQGIEIEIEESTSIMEEN